MKQNCEKWSLMSETIFPLMVRRSKELTKISVSINDVLLRCTPVGLPIVGTIEKLCQEVYKLFPMGARLVFRRSVFESVSLQIVLLFHLVSTYFKSSSGELC